MERWKGGGSGNGKKELGSEREKTKWKAEVEGYKETYVRDNNKQTPHGVSSGRGEVMNRPVIKMMEQVEAFQ